MRCTGPPRYTLGFGVGEARKRVHPLRQINHIILPLINEVVDVLDDREWWGIFVGEAVKFLTHLLELLECEHAPLSHITLPKRILRRYEVVVAVLIELMEVDACPLNNMVIDLLESQETGEILPIEVTTLV